MFVFFFPFLNFSSRGEENFLLHSEGSGSVVESIVQSPQRGEKLDKLTLASCIGASHERRVSTPNPVRPRSTPPRRADGRGVFRQLQMVSSRKYERNLGTRVTAVTRAVCSVWGGPPSPPSSKGKSTKALVSSVPGPHTFSSKHQ